MNDEIYEKTDVDEKSDDVKRCASLILLVHFFVCLSAWVCLSIPHDYSYVNGQIHLDLSKKWVF